VRIARESASQAQATPRGVLRVSLPLALGELVIMPALPRLLARHPGLSIETMLTDRYVDLTTESFDAVVRIGRPRESGLTRRALPPVGWATVAAPSYLARHATPARPDDLVRHNCLRFVLPSGLLQPWLFKGRAGIVRISPSGDLASDHPGGLLQATLAGHGLLQAHRYIVVNALKEGRLVEVLSDHQAPPLPLAVLFPAGRARTPKVRAFIDAVADLFSTLA
jgi:LysR family transcriptional regulator for bpeEF and oprC